MRLTTIGGLHYMSVRDLIMVVCEKNAKAAWQAWNRDISEVQRNELKQFTKIYQFQGKSLSSFYMNKNGKIIKKLCLVILIRKK